MGIFYDAKGQLTPQSEVGSTLNTKLIEVFMVVLVTCKNEEDPIKNEGARVVTTLFIDFSDAQGHLTPKSEKESCRNSNSSKLLWLVLLTPKIVNEYDQEIPQSQTADNPVAP